MVACGSMALLKPFRALRYDAGLAGPLDQLVAPPHDVIDAETRARLVAASPYNAAFAQSMDIVQDFWNVPVYNELIASTAQQLGEALDGKKSSKDALAALAAEHEKILSQAP